MCMIEGVTVGKKIFGIKIVQINTFLGLGQSLLLRKAVDWYTASDSNAQRNYLGFDVSVLRIREC